MNLFQSKIHCFASPGKFLVISKWPMDDNEESRECEMDSLPEAIKFANDFMIENPGSNVVVYDDQGKNVHMVGDF